MTHPRKRALVRSTPDTLRPDFGAEPSAPTPPTPAPMSENDYLRMTLKSTRKHHAFTETVLNRCIGQLERQVADLTQIIVQKIAEGLIKRPDSTRDNHGA
jgi:hypothetical protein